MYINLYPHDNTQDGGELSCRRKAPGAADSAMSRSFTQGEIIHLHHHHSSPSYARPHPKSQNSRFHRLQPPQYHPQRASPTRRRRASRRQRRDEQIVHSGNCARGRGRGQLGKVPLEDKLSETSFQQQVVHIHRQLLSSVELRSHFPFVRALCHCALCSCTGRLFSTLVST